MATQIGKLFSDHGGEVVKFANKHKGELKQAANKLYENREEIANTANKLYDSGKQFANMANSGEQMTSSNQSSDNVDPVDNEVKELIKQLSIHSITKIMFNRLCDNIRKNKKHKLKELMLYGLDEYRFNQFGIQQQQPKQLTQEKQPTKLTQLIPKTPLYLLLERTNKYEYSKYKQRLNDLIFTMFTEALIKIKPEEFAQLVKPLINITHNQNGTLKEITSLNGGKFNITPGTNQYSIFTENYVDNLNNDLKNNKPTEFKQLLISALTVYVETNINELKRLLFSQKGGSSNATEKVKKILIKLEDDVNISYNNTTNQINELFSTTLMLALNNISKDEFLEVIKPLIPINKGGKSQKYKNNQRKNNQHKTHKHTIGKRKTYKTK